ncbi:MAG: hypothetical protein ACFNYM_02670 [Bacteroidota bacterium]
MRFCPLNSSLVAISVKSCSVRLLICSDVRLSIPNTPPILSHTSAIQSSIFSSNVLSSSCSPLSPIALAIASSICPSRSKCR